MPPRYSYKKASISSPLLRAERVEVKFVSDGLALLYGLGEGYLHMGFVAPGFDIVEPELYVPYRRVAGRETDDIWKIIDSEADVVLAKSLPCRSPHIHFRKGTKIKDLKVNSQWHSELNESLDQVPPAGFFRLRHYAAITIADIKVNDHHFAMNPMQRAAKDAELTHKEPEIAHHFHVQNKLNALLHLTDIRV